jgi:hypothetical protein
MIIEEADAVTDDLELLTRYSDVSTDRSKTGQFSALA